MRISENFISKTRKWIIAGAITGGSAIAVSAMLISGTFALANNDITGTFNPVDNSLTKISINETVSGMSGSKLALSSDTAILTTDVTVQPSLLTGHASGVAAVAYVTSAGTGRNINYQVYDPNGIAGYRIPGGEMDIDKAGEDPVLIDLILNIDAGTNGEITTKALTDWNNSNPNNKISWISLQPAVVKVDDPTSGYFTAVDKGSAVLIGTVTDKWGVKQSVSILVTIGDAGATPGPTPTVTGVNIAPGPTVDVAAGSSLQFSAEVTGTDNPSQSVNWTVSGSQSTGTSISSNGLLVVSSDETSPTLTIKAVSLQDQSKTASVTVNITGNSGPITDTPEGTADRVLDNNKTGDGTWIEIAKSGGYSLIVRANYINVSGGHTGDPAYQYVDYGDTNVYQTSNVRTAINNWFNRNVTGSVDSLSAGARLRQFTVQNNAASVLGTSNKAAGGLTNGFSKPTDIKISSGADDVAFALSYCESANFISKQYALTGGGGYEDSSQIAVSNFSKLNIPQTWCYGMWLRSPGDNSTYQTGGALDYTGGVYQFHITHENEHGLIYPALWVDSAIFN